MVVLALAPIALVVWILWPFIKLGVSLIRWFIAMFLIFGLLGMGAKWFNTNQDPAPAAEQSSGDILSAPYATPSIEQIWQDTHPK